MTFDAAPGYLSDLFSAFYPLSAASPVLKTLDLGSYGLRWSYAPAVLAHVLPDDRCAVLSRDRDVTAQSLAGFRSAVTCVAGGEKDIGVTHSYGRFWSEPLTGVTGLNVEPIAVLLSTRSVVSKSDGSVTLTSTKMMSPSSRRSLSATTCRSLSTYSCSSPASGSLGTSRIVRRAQSRRNRSASVRY